MAACCQLLGPVRILPIDIGHNILSLLKKDTNHLLLMTLDHSINQQSLDILMHQLQEKKGLMVRFAPLPKTDPHHLRNAMHSHHIATSTLSDEKARGALQDLINVSRIHSFEPPPEHLNESRASVFDVRLPVDMTAQLHEILLTVYRAKFVAPAIDAIFKDLHESYQMVVVSNPEEVVSSLVSLGWKVLFATPVVRADGSVRELPIPLNVFTNPEKISGRF